jgi:hypothetical protein
VYIWIKAFKRIEAAIKSEQSAVSIDKWTDRHLWMIQFKTFLCLIKNPFLASLFFYAPTYRWYKYWYRDEIVVELDDEFKIFIQHPEDIHCVKHVNRTYQTLNSHSHIILLWWTMIMIIWEWVSNVWYILLTFFILIINQMICWRRIVQYLYHLPDATIKIMKLKKFLY